jgi:hypothetical protein
MRKTLNTQTNRNEVPKKKTMVALVIAFPQMVMVYKDDAARIESTGWIADRSRPGETGAGQNHDDVTTMI